MHHFYQRAALEAISKLPLQDDTLIHARFVDFFPRENASLEDVDFFLKNYAPINVNPVGGECGQGVGI